MKKVYKPKKSLIESAYGYLQGFGSAKNLNYKNVEKSEVDALIKSMAVDQSVAVTDTTGRVVSQLRTFYTSKDALIEEYNSLDPSDPVISSCLDQYADACIIMPATKEDGEPYDILGDQDKEIKTIENLFRDQKIPANLWQWVRHLCKYGELFIINKVPKGGKGRYIIEIETDPKRFSCIQVQDQICILDNYEASFVDKDEKGNDVSKLYAEKIGCDKVKIVHVALPSRTEACKVIDLVISYDKILKVRDKSGSSILDPVLIITRIIKLIEDMLLISRLDKSQMTRIYSMEVGKADEKKVKQMINNFRSLISSRQVLNTLSNNYSAGKSAKILNEIIVPTREGVGAISVEDISSDFRVGDLGDLSYFQNKFYAGIKIPKVYLGYEEDAPSGFGEDPLTKIDARFAKAVRRITASMEDGLNRVIKSYYSLTNNKSAEIPNITVMMYRDRTKDELEMAQNNETVARSVGEIINTLKMDTRLDSDKVTEAIFKEMLPLISSLVYNEKGGVKKKFLDENPEEDKEQLPPITRFPQPNQQVAEVEEEKEPEPSQVIEKTEEIKEEGKSEKKESK